MGAKSRGKGAEKSSGAPGESKKDKSGDEVDDGYYDGLESESSDGSNSGGNGKGSSSWWDRLWGKKNNEGEETDVGGLGGSSKGKGSEEFANRHQERLQERIRRLEQKQQRVNERYRVVNAKVHDMVARMNVLGVDTADVEYGLDVFDQMLGSAFESAEDSMIILDEARALAAFETKDEYQQKLWEYNQQRVDAKNELVAAMSYYEETIKPLIEESLGALTKEPDGTDDASSSEDFDFDQEESIDPEIQKEEYWN